MLHALKYGGGTQYLSDMSQIAKSAKELSEFLKDALLVPVPIHWTRRFKRKYNQAQLIANMLVKTFPDANLMVKNLLKRNKHITTQTTLDRQNREKNIRGAFEIRSQSLLDKTDKTLKIVIIDDVMTSGATLSECAGVLKRAGFSSVDVFAIAKKL